MDGGDASTQEAAANIYLTAERLETPSPLPSLLSFLKEV